MLRPEGYFQLFAVVFLPYFAKRATDSGFYRFSHFEIATLGDRASRTVVQFHLEPTNSHDALGIHYATTMSLDEASGEAFCHERQALALGE